MATIPLWTLRIPYKFSLRTFRSARSPGTTPRTIKRPPLLSNSALPRFLSTTTMPAHTMHHRKVSPFTPTSPYMNDIHMADSYPQTYDPDSMLFDFDDPTFGEPPSSAFSDIWGDVAIQPKLQPPFQYEHPQAYSDQYFDPHFSESPSYNNELYLSNWVHDDIANSPTSPIPIPQSQAFSTPSTTSGSLYSPPNFAAMQPLPSSASPASFDDMHRRQRVDSMDSISPSEISLATPNWTTQLWDVDSPRMHTRAASSRSPVRRHSPMSTGPHRVRDTSPMQMFQSASAPTAPHMARAYSSSRGDIDRDATVRRKRKTSDPAPSADKDNESSTPAKSALRPPKLAPSAWQLYFTDWIQKQQATSTRKLNVAQAAKEAGQEYAGLTTDEKEPYKRRSQAMKEAREREMDAYMRSLTPDDIKRENVFRAAQRKAGKSRKSNIKDPNAPKKPLSAYFMFLQRIRANPQLVKDIFGHETETTKQSVLAAAKWRSMTDEERKPFLAQAEQEKMEYESARRMYEEGTPSLGTTINFSILGSPLGGHLKLESDEGDFLDEDRRHRQQ
ncbi:hypothetical protein CYLTODRAFT_420393 [Cylindrobasidium torrendii FP15055 ss-10]|uniref:HMG box domain-containing protein n=1 Tax=Cylindrobasidium torrendii FP15055 ss-10 TaxID=1314674 RepID=A0A0D7BJB6_9AGAR|nr:hypothetical protein CYLTODRAFT_420393 [Cylindrobasidium torrendii FP15055 ss-10]